jgi:cell shape-determining protein MreC
VKRLRFFLRSKQFKKAVFVVALIIVITVTAGLVGGFMAPHAGVMGAVAAPFQKLAALVTDSWNDFSGNFKSAAKLSAENEKLKNEINNLRQQLVDYNEAVNENDFYEEYLEIKEDNPDFKFRPAMKISSDPDDVFGGFTVEA